MSSQSAGVIAHASRVAALSLLRPLAGTVVCPPTPCAR
jgi:hypothetical protein